MQLSDFSYDLPPELIAQHPARQRTASRLLHVDSAGRCHDRQFLDCPAFFEPGDVLVLNDTKVIPARLFGRKATGGKVEVLLERVIGDKQLLAQVKASKSPKPGTDIIINGGGDFPEVALTVTGRQDSFFELSAPDIDDIYTWLDAVGRIPLPPYIERAEQSDGDSSADAERYQTVFARHQGAVAAPTAGLHFDEATLARIKELGVHIVYVTLHVGAGTYQPVRVDDVTTHKMHKEQATVSAQTCAVINQARARGNRVVAVGTTVVRSLETAATSSLEQGASPDTDDFLQPFHGDTDIFIYPGFKFRIIDALLTNFHLPESTLLMLVSAFAGRDVILDAYNHAVQQRYRFFSYGDAMLLERAGT